MGRACLRVCLGAALALLLAATAGAQQSPEFTGFDRNSYPGDSALPALHRHFAFTGYWLTPPPGETVNTWQGKRETLVRAGFGFLVLANGKDEAVIQAAARQARLTAVAIGQRDGAAAAVAARQEHFPTGTIVFVDQEEGGRLTSDQAEYLRGWVSGLVGGGYRAGIYLSGQPVSEGHGQHISTAADVRERMQHGYFRAPVQLWVYQDACPPSNGCRLMPPPLARSGTPEAEVWQYAQSPRRPQLTAACARTYAADGNCYAPDLPGLHLDLNVARTEDPSHGR
ncbi:MAG: DUF1906 domain-containing protein [Acidobacteriota bacterium]|nr:DUF1906 domain-containing protein [Acidobacteriota bacterium]